MRTPAEVLQAKIDDMLEERRRINEVKNPHNCDRVKFEADRKVDLAIIDESINEFQNAINKLL